MSWMYDFVENCGGNNVNKRRKNTTDCNKNTPQIREQRDRVTPDYVKENIYIEERWNKWMRD